MKKQEPPIQMLSKGKSDGHQTIVVEVKVCLDPNGRVWSTHGFQDAEDEKLAFSWPGGGVRHVAHALFLEALRHEAYVSTLSRLSRDPGFLASYTRMSDEDREKVHDQLGKAVTVIFQRNAEKLGESVAHEILDMIVSQIGDDDDIRKKGLIRTSS